MKDLVIIGAGPAGLTASIYAARSGLDLVLTEKLSPGGQVMNTYEVENYPGFVEPLAGWELMSRMEAQARRLGVEIVSTEIKGLEKKGNIFRLTASGGDIIEAKAVIAASGASYRRLNAPGEKELTGRGVSYCATCDGAFFKEKKVAVVGGGDTALEEAYFLTRFADKVYLIHRRDRFRAVKVIQDRICRNSKIEQVCDTTLVSINGIDKVESVGIKNKKDGTESELQVDGVFIFVGIDPNTSYLPGDVLDENGEVIVDKDMMTGVKGLFAAGDLLSGSLKQIVIAGGTGAIAAIKAYDYIETEWD